MHEKTEMASDLSCLANIRKEVTGEICYHDTFCKPSRLSCVVLSFFYCLLADHDYRSDTKKGSILACKNSIADRDANIDEYKFV